MITRKDGISAQMLRITAKINIGNGGGNLQNVTSTVAGIGGSSPISAMIGHHTQIQKPFILGRSRLGGGDCYTKQANFYIGSIPSNSEGNFSSNYVITLSGSNITQITIVFNKQKGQYPKSINVDGTIHYDDDPIWTIPIAGANTHTITISNWNTPNAPMVISSIYTDLSIDIDDSNILNFNRTIMEKDNYKQPSFGIISNGGSISFIDKNGEIADYVAQQIINSKNEISVYLENADTGKKAQIARFNTQQWEYKNSQSVVGITLKDNLEEWQGISVPAINYTPTVSTNQTAEWLYKYLQNEKITPAKYNMLSFDQLDSKTKSVLSGTTIQYPLLESDNLWAEWNKLCELCFLNIYKDNDGRTICKYSGE